MININSKEFLLQVSLIELLVRNGLKDSALYRLHRFYTESEKKEFITAYNSVTIDTYKI